MRTLFILLISLIASSAIYAQEIPETRFYNIAADTAQIAALLDEASSKQFSRPEERVAFFARKFEGIPYAAHTLECAEGEVLTVRLDSLDCTTFVDVCMALAYTIGENRSSWRDFVYNLRRMRYRGGEIDGYASRLHYNSDWVVDNVHRGNIIDATKNFARINYLTRTLDFMSQHRNSYAALQDSANYARIIKVESGYKNHRFPYIKTIDLSLKENKAQFHNGDVLGFVCNMKDLDTTHMGIVLRESPSAEPYVIHASMSGGKVVITTNPLAEFVKKNRSWIGVRVFRLAE